jgi:hypothetical protein
LAPGFFGSRESGLRPDMAISDKTRKILWGRSGNRCAVCRNELVIEATAVDDDAVIGDECHIVSGQTHGPRHDSAFPIGSVDSEDNLLLLCRVHHKMVDDQFQTYTPEALRRLKADHEAWVSQSLSGEESIPPLRLRRLRDNVPSHLVRLVSGKGLAAVISDSYGYSFDYEHTDSDVEIELIAAFFEEIQDWADLWTDFGVADRIRATRRLGDLLRDLEAGGFWAFGGREIRRLEGGGSAPSDFPIAILQVIRPSNEDVLKVQGDSTRPEPQSDIAPRNADPLSHDGSA